MGTQLPSQRGGRAPPPIFGAFYCVQTAGCIKMSLGMEVDLSPGDFVFDGDPATPRKRAHPSPPNFWSMSIVPNGWIDEDATWYGSRPRPRPRGPSYSRKKHNSPLFSAHAHCGHGRPSQLLLSSCSSGDEIANVNFLRRHCTCRCHAAAATHVEPTF